MFKYGYHVGSKIYKDIRPLGLQSTKEAKEGTRKVSKYFNKEGLEQYLKEVNFFLFPINFSHVKVLAENGFNEWQVEKLYLYKFSIPENKKLKWFKVQSSIEETAYHNVFWKKFYQLHQNETEEIFIKSKRTYKKRMYEVLNKENNLSRRMNYSELKKIKIDIRNFNPDYLFPYNVECGAKEQYASCITHISGETTAPIKYDSFTILTEDYIIKPLDEADAYLIADIIRRSFDSTDTLEDIYKLFKIGRKFIGYYQNSSPNLLGVMQLEQLKGITMLHTLCSVKNGIGKELMSYYIDYCLSAATDGKLEAISKETIKYYEKFGFKLINNTEYLMVLKLKKEK